MLASLLVRVPCPELHEALILLDCWSHLYLRGLG